VIKVNRRPII